MGSPHPPLSIHSSIHSSAGGRPSARSRGNSAVSLRRKSVFAKKAPVVRALSPRSRLIDIVQTSPALRSDEQLLFLESQLSGTEFFAKYSESPGIRFGLYGILELQRVAKGDYVFLQGDVGRHFYIVLSGLVAVLVGTPAEEEEEEQETHTNQKVAKKVVQAKARVRSTDIRRAENVTDQEHMEAMQMLHNLTQTEVARLSAGMCFGELALVHEQPRAATVVAMEDTELLCISKHDFDTFVKEMEEAKIEELRSLLMKVPSFALLDRAAVLDVQPFFKETHFSRGHAILRQGHPVILDDPGLFVIVKGSVRAQYELAVPHHKERRLREDFSSIKHASAFLFDSKILSPGKRVIDLGILGPGQSFGEFAFITQQSQPVSFVSEDCACLHMTATQYYQKLRVESSGLVEKLSLARHRAWYDRIVTHHRLFVEQPVNAGRLTSAPPSRLPLWRWELKGPSALTYHEQERLRALDARQERARAINAERQAAKSIRERQNQIALASSAAEHSKHQVTKGATGGGRGKRGGRGRSQSRGETEGGSEDRGANDPGAGERSPSSPLTRRRLRRRRRATDKKVRKGEAADYGSGDAVGDGNGGEREWDDGGALEEAFVTMKNLRSELPDLFPRNITREEAYLARDLSRASCSIIPPLPSLKFKLNAGLWKVLREELERAERGSDEDTASEEDGIFVETGSKGERHWNQIFPGDDGSDLSDYEGGGPRLSHQNKIKGML